MLILHWEQEKEYLSNKLRNFKDKEITKSYRDTISQIIRIQSAPYRGAKQAHEAVG